MSRWYLRTAFTNDFPQAILIGGVKFNTHPYGGYHAACRVCVTQHLPLLLTIGRQKG
jgi:hypothetical protein